MFFVKFQPFETISILQRFNFSLLKIILASSSYLSMLTLLGYAYSTRLKSSKHSKMSAVDTKVNVTIFFLRH